MDLNDVRKPEQFYNMREVSEFMGVSYITLFRMVKSGKIKAQNIAKTGKRPIYAFKAEDVQTYYDNYGAIREGNSKQDLKKVVGP